MSLTSTKMESSKIAIYIHWPFCLSKCPYCDFNSHVSNEINYDLWNKSYIKEIQYFSNFISGKNITSIYFGGGTPSLMQAQSVEIIIDALAKLGTITSTTEITLEANPSSAEIDKFAAFKSAGINRISIGIQSLRQNALQQLGRNHDVQSAINAIHSARKIFERYSFDLIYARFDQSLKDWQIELGEAITLANGHLSLYQLTIEKGTQFYSLLRQGIITTSENDLAADMYEWTHDFMQMHGYNNYEISNYARNNHESMHNLTYWNYESYIGIGPGAHSRIKFHTHEIDNKVRSITTIHNPKKWLESVNSRGHGIQNSQYLNFNEIVQEYIMMGLRIKNGILISAIEAFFNCKIDALLNLNLIKQYQKLGFIQNNNSRLAFTLKGFMVHSYIVPRIIEFSGH